MALVFNVVLSVFGWINGALGRQMIFPVALSTHHSFVKITHFGRIKVVENLLRGALEQVSNVLHHPIWL